ncbi:hypothetical protein AMTRI_Chr07g74570 [Amborella trichopoda]
MLPFWCSLGSIPTPACVLPAEGIMLWFVFKLMRLELRDVSKIGFLASSGQRVFQASRWSRVFDFL